MLGSMFVGLLVILAGSDQSWERMGCFKNVLGWIGAFIGHFLGLGGPIIAGTAIIQQY